MTPGRPHSMPARTATLSRAMSEREFDNGYWYAKELRAFARDLGVPAAGKLRKDELERAIRHFLRTGEVTDVAPRADSKAGRRDVDEGLALNRVVRHYT